MRILGKEEKGSVAGKRAYVGIDVHKENWQVTVRTEGEEIFNGRIPGQYPSLKKLLERYEGSLMKVAYEAGPFGFWLSDKLSEDNIEAMVVPPSLIPVESGNRVKTDIRDSRKLAKLLESNMLKQVYVLTPEEREHRDLLRTRRQIARINKRVALLCRDKKYHDRIKLLCTAPGIGRLTAIEILVELQDISRFKSAEELPSYIGLTPSEYSTGEKTRQDRITRCGNKRVRTYLVESTWMLITKDPAIGLKYLKLKAARGGKRATIVIARKFLIVVRRMLLDNVPYRMAA
jgi:transposase